MPASRVRQESAAKKMAIHRTKLKRTAGDVDVAAALHDWLPRPALFDAEHEWCRERVAVARALADVGVGPTDSGWPQDLHWSWAYKAAACRLPRLEASGDVRLFGVKADRRWQGLLLGLSEGHTSRLAPLQEPLVYIDYIEAAPWNWDVRPIRQVGRFKGVGTQLMELAVRWSMSLGFEGRIGLHSLPQAKGFYSGRCQFRELGVDPNYHRLTYFELTAAGARTFLGSRR